MLLLSQGRTSEIYVWDDQRVVKLFRDWCPSDWVEYETKVAHAVYAAGVSSPAPSEIVEVNGRRGLIYERLEGVSMLQDMNMRPWMLFKHARSLAELQVQINQQSITGIPTYKARWMPVIAAARLSENIIPEKAALIKIVKEGIKE